MQDPVVLYQEMWTKADELAKKDIEKVRPIFKVGKKKLSEGNFYLHRLDIHLSQLMNLVVPLETIEV